MLNKRHNIRFAVFILLIYCAILHPAQSYGKTQHEFDQTALQSLAESFVSKLDPVYEELENQQTSQTQKQQNLSTLPDGTSLILIPRVRDLIFDTDIFAVKREGDVYLSFADFIFALNLPIEFNQDTGIASGWFLREDWRFDMNIPREEIISRGESFPFIASDFYEEDGILFIASDAIMSWMDMRFNFDLAQQYVELMTPITLPKIQRLNRQKRQASLLTDNNEPELPRADQPKEFFHLQAGNINERLRYSKFGSSGEGNWQESTNVSLQGQLLKQEADVNFSRDSEDGVQNVFARLSSRVEDRSLLGPLRANYYQFGDISSTSVPLTGGSQAGLGARISNSELLTDSFTSTVIEGNATPGWDVELYRDNTLVGTQVSGPDGRYRFENVALFAGENNFEIFFYGLQGQIRKETLLIPVNAELISQQGGVYDVSVTLDGERVYDTENAQGNNDGEVDLAASYNTIINGELFEFGFRSRPISDDRYNFLTAGTVTVRDGNILNATLALDEDLNVATQFGLRREQGDWDFSAGLDLLTRGFGATDGGNPTVMRFDSIVQKSHDGLFGRSGNFRFNADYNLLADGGSFYDLRLSASETLRRLSFNGGLFYDGFSLKDVEREDGLGASLSMRGRIGRGFVRGGVDYRFMPQSAIERYFLQGYYTFGSNRTADLTWDRIPETGFSRTRLNVNFENKYFTTSPFMEVNSNDDMRAGVNLNFNLVETPQSPWPHITSDRIVGRGVVQANVFLDKNGNLKFDEEDEGLPDVILKSINSRKRATTDETGFAALYELQPNFPTDITIDEDSLPDYFMVSAFEGRSVLPLAGQIYRFEFPVHMAGEIDGTVYRRSPSGERSTMSNFVMDLLPLDDPSRPVIDAQVAFDGFYLFSQIPPGQYLMVMRESTLSRDVGNPMPEVFEITYEGDVFFGTDIEAREEGGFVDYRVTYDKQGVTEPEFSLLVKSTGMSELSKLVKRILLARYSHDALSELDKVDVDTTLAKRGFDRYTGTREEMHEACAKLSQKNITCYVEVHGITVAEDESLAL